MVRRLAALMLLATVVLVPLPASAGPADQTTCEADLLVSFDPGLTFSEESQEIRIRGSLASCTGADVLSGTIRGSGSGELSCTSGSAEARATIRWDTGERSLLRGSVDVDAGTVTGSVVRGKFAGEDVDGSLTITPLEGDCLFDPVTRASATGTVTI
jgi:hypothetical protein